ncbi:protein CLN8 [Hemicordylus capensis]|uniref:protein CLN8 n=1 Tax=Hemicordylus capensis TaxID=884348 RepID=UPI002304358F|nr:protein CLN8 [Hemicordylus capensis]XP_053142155.1 protein CLN8 [Hemicordylus capensis]XP_053142156.1 protein CLN8 [Hemicordylus capensis]XP_053142157.1 protein CLN8 [Hemicordylus capensis]
MNLGNDEAASRSIFAWDYVLWEVRLKLVAAGFFIYLGIFLLSHYLSSWMSTVYRSLPPKEKVFWNLAATRGVFGIQSCVAGLWALLLDPVFQADKVYSQQEWSWFNCLIASGFFLLENVAVHVSNIVFRTFDLFLVVHHFLAFGGFFGLVTNIKSGHYIPLMGMLLEMSTPFTCISWMLLKVGWANTLFWKVNQFVMIHMFHCRMILTYHMWWVSISNWSAVVENLGLLHFVVVFTGLSSVTVILNPYWTYKKTQQLVCPVDWNFTNRTMKNGSSKKLNGETCQKKGL